MINGDVSTFPSAASLRSWSREGRIQRANNTEAASALAVGKRVSRSENADRHVPGMRNDRVVCKNGHKSFSEHNRLIATTSELTFVAEVS